MRAGVLAVVLVCFLMSPRVGALDLDVTLEDIERALAIARATESERAAFHAPYRVAVNTPFVETVEVVSEFRRVVLLAEERIRKGDRAFGYSTRLAAQAVAPWKQRVAIVARLRFHPQNNYVGVPNVEVILPGRQNTRVGVLRQPILSLPSSNPADRLPVLGAQVEGVFDAAPLGNATHSFDIHLEGKPVGHATFDLAALR